MNSSKDKRVMRLEMHEHVAMWFTMAVSLACVGLSIAGMGAVQDARKNATTATNENSAAKGLKKDDFGGWIFLTMLILSSLVFLTTGGVYWRRRVKEKRADKQA